MNVYEQMAELTEKYIAAIVAQDEAQQQAVALRIAAASLVLMPELMQVARIIERDVPPTLAAIEAAAAFVQAPELEKDAPYAAMVEALKNAGAL
jgi:hypothetical protein